MSTMPHSEYVAQTLDMERVNGPEPLDDAEALELLVRSIRAKAREEIANANGRPSEETRRLADEMKSLRNFADALVGPERWMP